MTDMTYIIQITTARGWRRLRDSANFLTRDGAEAYARKYLRPGWRIVEVAACSICGKPATTAAGPANEPICAECEAEMMVEL